MKYKIIDTKEVDRIINSGGGQKDLEDYILSLNDGTKEREEMISKEMNELASEKLRAMREKVVRDMGLNNGGYNVKSYYISLDKYLLFLSLGLFLLTAINFYVTYISK